MFLSFAGLGWFKPPTETSTHAGRIINDGIEDCNASPDRYNVSDWLFNITADPEEKVNLYMVPELEATRDEMLA